MSLPVPLLAQIDMIKETCDKIKPNDLDDEKLKDAGLKADQYVMNACGDTALGREPLSTDKDFKLKQQAANYIGCSIAIKRAFRGTNYVSDAVTYKDLGDEWIKIINMGPGPLGTGDSNLFHLQIKAYTTTRKNPLIPPFMSVY
jgi:hypothetical protein